MAISDRIDSIEQHLKESYQELQGIGIDTSEVDNNLKNIPKLIDGYWQTLPKVTGEGTSITLDNTKEGKMGIIYKGNTYQNSLTGINLANPSGVIDGSYTTNEQIENNTGYTNEGEGIYRILRIENLPAGSYTFQIIWSDTARLLRRYNDGSTANIFLNVNIYNFTTTTTGLFAIQFRNSTTTAFTDNDYKLMLVSGTYTSGTMPEYQEYVGGQPSPNPDYPQEIQVVSGDNTIKVEGKNLWGGFSTSISRSSSGVDFVSNADGTTSANGTATATVNSITSSLASENNYYIHLIAGTYTISGNKPNYYNLQVVGIDATEYASTSSSTTKTTFTLNNDADCFIRIRVLNGAVLSNETIYPMLEKGSSASEYEPYQSASYPINLPVENLFDKDNANILNNIYVSLNDDKLATTTGTKTLYISIKGGETYTVSKTISQRFAIGTTETTPQANVSLIDKIQRNTASELTLETSSNANYLCVFFLHSSDTLTEQQILDSIQIEVGTKANTYVPYGTTPIELCKIGTYQDRIFKSSGKNLFDKDSVYLKTGASFNGVEDNVFTTTTQNTNTLAIVKVPSSSNITISFNNSNYSSSRVYVAYLKNPTTEAGWRDGWYTGSVTLQTSEKTQYLGIVIQLRGTGSSTNLQSTQELIDIVKIQVEVGSATPYEPYGTGWCLNKQIGKVVLDGTEDGWGTTNKTYTLSNIIKSATHSGVSTLLGISNYFKWGNGATATYVYGSFWTNDGGIHLRFQKEETPNLSDFKTWLSTHNTEVYYVLATPTYTEIEGTLKEQLETIKTSYEGQTNISQENNDLASVLNASALSNTTITPSLQSIQPLSLGQSLQNEEPMVDEEPLIDEETPNETLQEDIIQENDNLTNILDDSELENM